MKIMDEDELFIENIRRGNISSFEKLFKENYHSLCYYAEDFLREKEAAEEVVSDFFLKFWENHESLVIQKSLKAYMYSSVRNNCIKNLERMKVQKKYSEYATYTLNHLDLLHPESSYPLSNLISKESVEEVELAIDSLPDQCREIFNLSRFEELTYEEIAERLGISINTVRTQMSRALVKLRLRLKKYLSLLVPLIFTTLAS